MKVLLLQNKIRFYNSTMSKKNTIIIALLGLMALPVFMESCASKKCGCLNNLNYVSPRKKR
jgi:hypothetical protein